MKAPGRPFPIHLLRHFLSRYLLMWLFLAFIISIVQTVLAAVLHEREDVRRFLGLLENMPKFFKAMIGGDELMPGNVFAIVAIGYQHPLILTMLLINGVATPTGLITAQMEKGTLELLLARPITRSRLLAITAILSLGSQFLLVGFILLGTAVWTRVFDYGEPIALKPFADIAFNLAMLACAGASLSILAGVAFNERNKAIGAIVGYLVISYLIEFSSVWLPSLKNIHPLTLFYYCRPNGVIRLGAIPWDDVGVLAAISGVSLFLAWIIWRRRDLYAA